MVKLNSINVEFIIRDASKKVRDAHPKHGQHHFLGERHRTCKYQLQNYKDIRLIYHDQKVNLFNLILK
jgi:hypothetical protein